MSKPFALHFKIVNICLAFVLFLIIISNFPHQQSVPIISWINWSLYFLLFLQCVFLLKQYRNNKPIFLNLGFFALLNSLTFIPIFVGNKHLAGSDYMAYYLWQYLTIALNLSFVLCIAYICFKYLFWHLRPAKIYLVSLAVVLPMCIWNFFPFIVDKNFIFSVDDAVFYKGVLVFNFLPLLLLLLYGLLLYKYDRSLGEHISTIMVCLFIMTIVDMANLFGYIYQIAVFSLTQYVLLVNLIFFLVTMFRLLNYSYSQFGQFYDSIIIAGNDFGVPIKRKKNISQPLLEFGKAYFHHRRNSIGFLSIISVFCINYFNLSAFLKLNLAVICFGILVLLMYLTALYQKRLKSENMLK